MIPSVDEELRAAFFFCYYCDFLVQYWERNNYFLKSLVFSYTYLVVEKETNLSVFVMPFVITVFRLRSVTTLLDFVNVSTQTNKKIVKILFSRNIKTYNSHGIHRRIYLNEMRMQMIIVMMMMMQFVTSD